MSSDIYIYIGPTIIGVIQQGAIRTGGREAALESFDRAIELYPDIARLVVPADKVKEKSAEARTRGTATNNIVRKLLKSYRTRKGIEIK